MPDWSTSYVSTAMCEGSRLHLVATGEISVAYARVYGALMLSNMLENVQAVYLHELPAGAKTNLLITPQGGRGHFRVEWNGEPADVRDVWRQTDTNNFFEGGFVIIGERFFGSFETVMNIHIQRMEDDHASFRADVLIYPHNGVIRFIFSNVLSVESYFRRTMQDMSAEMKRLCTSLAQQDVAPAPAAPSR